LVGPEFVTRSHRAVGNCSDPIVLPRRLQRNRTL
jgi:hypothetical protein